MMKQLNSYSSLIILSIIFLLASCACSSQKDDLSIQKGSTDVAFEAEMAGNIGLRAADNLWDEGDAIGIYMMEAGSENILAANKQFASTSSGTSPRFLPQTNADKIEIVKGSSVDFVAYHPYSKSINQGSLHIDLRDQTDPTKINLMTANNLQAIASAQNLRLSFVHRLSKLVFNLQAEQPHDLENLSVQIKGMPVTADYHVLTNTFSNIGSASTAFAPLIVKEANMTRVEVFVLPGIELNDAKVIFDIGGHRSYTWMVRRGQVYDAGKVFTYKVNLKGGGGVEPSAHPFLEMPQITAMPNTVVITHYTTDQKNQRNFTMLYDREHRLAYWVAYPLHASYIGNVDRTNKWAYDPQISLGEQYNLRRSFQGGSYDRGHQLPSGDRTSSVRMNEQTFFYSNMTAQFSSLNQGQWAQLEIKTRQWMDALSANGAGNDTLYVVTGAALSIAGKPTITLEPTKDNSGVDASIPQYYYKALAKKDKQGLFQTIAFLIPNQQITAYRDYQISVAELERYTGLTFFPGINATSKQSVNAAQWR